MSPLARRPALGLALVLLLLGLMARPCLATDDLVLVGSDALYRGDVVAAQRAFESALRQDPDNDFARNQLALCLARQEEFDKAEELFAQVAGRSPDNVFSRLWMGIIALNDDDPSGAVGWFQDVLERAPDHPGALYLLGVEAASRRDLAGAVEYFNKAGRSGKDDADLQFRLAESYRGLGMRANARLSYVRAVEADPRHIGALVGLGWLAYDEGRRQEAFRAWGRALEVAPGQGEARASLGAVLVREGLELRTEGRVDEARATFAKALEFDPGNKAALYYLR